MGSLIRLLLPMRLLHSLLKPMTRLIVSLLAIPLFRLLMRRVAVTHDLDRELEKDLEEWFRGSLLLLVATANMEQQFFGWVTLDLRHDWLLLAGRLLLAMGVIEAMPDQEMFSIIHPGPRWKIDRKRPFRSLYEQRWALLKGLLCQHLNRSSPVLAIMAAILNGTVGWVCYGLAIAQYLVIGLVTSRDRALDVLAAFDRQMALRREELVEELEEQRERGAVGAASAAPPTDAAAADEPPPFVAKPGGHSY